MHRRSALPATGILARGPLTLASTLVTAAAVAAGLSLAQTPAGPVAAAPAPVQHTTDPRPPEVGVPEFRPAASAGDAAEARALVGLHTTPGRVTEIPARTLASYQRSATVLGRAAPGCGLEWTVVAAVAGVLTDHGSQRGSHRTGEDGAVRPAIISTPLRYPDGAPIPDTDGGRLDGDARADRAVGPFLLPPALWREVGVDGDGDGIRNPQDFDDASLAAAVLLCADGVDLSDAEDRTTALQRFAPDGGFVKTVAQVAAAYEADDGAPLVQAGSLTARSVLPLEAPVREMPAPEPDQEQQKSKKPDKKPGGAQAQQEGTGQQDAVTEPAPSPQPAPAPDEATPTGTAAPPAPAEDPSGTSEAAPPPPTEPPVGAEPEPTPEPEPSPEPEPGPGPAEPVPVPVTLGPVPGVTAPPAPPAAAEPTTESEDAAATDSEPDEAPAGIELEEQAALAVPPLVPFALLLGLLHRPGPRHRATRGLRVTRRRPKG